MLRHTSKPLAFDEVHDGTRLDRPLGRQRSLAWLIGACFLGLSISAQPARSSPLIYDQVSRTPRHLCGCWTSDIGSDGGWTSYDDFELANDALVSEVRWTGAYWDTESNGSNPVDIDTEEWRISILNSRESNGRMLPGTTVYSERILVDEVTTNFIGEFEFDDARYKGVEVPVYEFSLQLSEPVALDAGRQYWFSPLSFSESLEPVFVWAVSDVVGKSFQSTSNSRFIRDNNFAFSLSGVDGDFDRNAVIDATDIDQLALQIRSETPSVDFDMNFDRQVNREDMQELVHEFAGTWFGDSNMDGEFNSSDFVHVFGIGHYEDGVEMNSGWSEGDWNGDGEFSSSDFVTAFNDGGYERGLRSAINPVPEPNGILLAACGVLPCLLRLRRTGRARPSSRKRGAMKGAVLIALSIVAAMVVPQQKRAFAVELFPNGGLDDLVAGSAPNNDASIGDWHFYPLTRTTNENNQFTEVFRFYEQSEDQVSIVSTSTFDASREGNSLRLKGDEEKTVQLYRTFDERVLEDPSTLLRASFEVFVTNPSERYAGAVIFSGDHGGGGATNTWDRGPQIAWDQGGLRATSCDSIHCSENKNTWLVDEVPGGQWQRIQMDIDLVADTYDVSSAFGDEPLQLVGDDLAFRAGELDHLDRINLALFPSATNEVGEGNLYLDNISVSLIDRSLPRIETVPEPHTASLLAIGTAVGALGVRRRQRVRYHRESAKTT